MRAIRHIRPALKFTCPSCVHLHTLIWYRIATLKRDVGAHISRQTNHQFGDLDILQRYADRLEHAHAHAPVQHCMCIVFRRMALLRDKLVQSVQIALCVVLVAVGQRCELGQLHTRLSKLVCVWYGLQQTAGFVAACIDAIDHERAAGFGCYQNQLARQLAHLSSVGSHSTDVLACTVAKVLVCKERRSRRCACEHKCRLLQRLLELISVLRMDALYLPRSDTVGRELAKLSQLVAKRVLLLLELLQCQVSVITDDKDNISQVGEISQMQPDVKERLRTVSEDETLMHLVLLITQRQDRADQRSSSRPERGQAA